MSATTTTGPRITQLRVAVGLLEIAKLELHQFNPSMDRTYEFTDTAFDLVGLMRIQVAATEHAANVTKKIQDVIRPLSPTRRRHAHP
jgi:hypothetical protein